MFLCCVLAHFSFWLSYILKSQLCLLTNKFIPSVLVIVIVDYNMLHEMRKKDYGKNIKNTSKTKYNSLERFNKYNLFFGRN